MTFENWPLRRIVLAWVGCLLLALLLMLTGSLLDAGGRASLGLVLFLLASVAVAAPLILTWHWRKDRRVG